MNELVGIAALPRSNPRHSARIIVFCFLIQGSLLTIPSARAIGATLSANSESPSPIQDYGSNRAQQSPDAGSSRSGTTDPLHDDLSGKPGQPNRIPQQTSPQVSRPNGNSEPHPGYGLPNYSWSRGGVSRLCSYFREDLRRVNRWHRQRMYVGFYLPHRYRMYIQPIPRGMMRYLPRVPQGYAMGYFDGYCLIYDPRSLLIVSVVDLYQF